MSVAQIKKKLLDTLSNGSVADAALILRNAPTQPLLHNGSGDPRQFNIEAVLQTFLKRGKTVDVANFVLKARALPGDIGDEIELTFPGPLLIRRLVEEHRFDAACRYFFDFALQDVEDLKLFIFERMLAERNYDRAMEEGKRFFDDFEGAGEQGFSAKSLIIQMIQAGRIETALKHIDRLKWHQEFPSKALFDRLSERGDFSTILRYSGRFNLAPAFPPEFIVAQMLAARRFTEAWKTIQMKGLTNMFPVTQLVKSAADQADFAAATQFIEDYSLAPRMNKTLDAFEKSLYQAIDARTAYETAHAKEIAGGGGPQSPTSRREAEASDDTTPSRCQSVAKPRNGDLD